MSLLKRSILNSSFYQWVTKYNLHHVGLWLLYFFFWAFIIGLGTTRAEMITNALIIVLIHAAVSYFNNYYLFPTYLNKRQYISYFVALGLTISLASLFVSGAFMLVEADLPSEDKRDLLSIRYLITNAMAIVYTTAVTLSLKLIKHWYEKERMAKRLEKLNAETELKYLKSQINPHFLFNSLNSVYALALQKSDLAPELILKLSDILRYILYEGSEKKVSLTQELKYLQSYLELEKVRHGERMDLSININGDTDTKEIAPMLLIPFVENSFKHGLGKDISKGYVNVEVEALDNQLHFSIANSKPINGSEVSNKKDYQGGIGLKNVRKRLNLLYPNKHKLTIGTEPKEFKVSLEIKL